MEIIGNMIMMLLALVDFVALIFLLNKVDCSVGQIILAIIFPPYMMYLLASIAKQKKLFVVLMIVTVITTIFAIFFIMTILDSYKTMMISSQSLASQNITEEVYNTMMEEKLAEFEHEMLSKFAVYFIIVGIANIITGVLQMIIYFFIGKSFSKSTGFCVGLALLTPIFLPILAFGDSSYNEWGY